MGESEDLVRDLRVFADPATDYSNHQSGGQVAIKLTRDGSLREYVADIASGTVTARHADGKRYPSVRALLSAEEFANVRALRATQRRLLSTRLGEKYIAPEGDLVATGHPPALGFDEMKRAVRYEAQDKLAIMLLDGPAGIGKTSLIERLVFDRTDPASEEPPLLHVTSSGSRLTDLSKALAHATQILRASITFDQVPILVRRGALQVAIDGFDELVDPSGYRDAWSALREFLGEVRSGGPTILSGRDTFFDQQTFQKRLADRISNLDLRYARLRPVSPRAAKAYLKESGWSEEQLSSAEAKEWFAEGSYRLRPFFLSQIASAGGWDDLESAHGSPQAFLVARFVRREAKLLSDFLPIALEQAEGALWQFYCTLVEDMAIHELDTVDSGYLALACETAFDGLLVPEDLSKLLHRAGSLGLLEADTQHGSRRFPHSEIQNQFLARALIQSLDSSASVGTFVRRVPISMALAEAFSDGVAVLDTDRARSLVNRLIQIGHEEPFATLLAANTRTLLIAALASPNLEGAVTLDGGATHEARLHGVAAPATLANLQIGHFDVRGADLRAVVFNETSIGVLTVDDVTFFGETIPTVTSCLQVQTLGGIQTERRPDEIRRWLSTHRAPAGDDADAAGLRLAKYFDRLCRKFARQHQIRASEDDEAYFLIRDPLWPEVQNILGARLVVEERTTAGTHDEFYRVIGPIRLLNPASDDAESLDIRRHLLARARELG